MHQLIEIDNFIKGIMGVRLRGEPIGVIANGEFKTPYPLCIPIFKEYLETLPKYPKKTEADYREEVVEYLRRKQYSIIIEQYTSYGYIDILAEKVDDQKIIEVKLEINSHIAAQALGQLLFYNKSYPDASLWVSSPKKPNAMILSVLKTYDINYLELL